MSIANYNIFTYESIDSTNDEAKRLFNDNIRQNSIIVAKTQTKGRGRNDRLWVSPEGNLYLTLLLVERYELDVAAQFSFIAAISLGEALEKYSIQDIQYKWPNDILLEDKKVAGILLESIMIEGKNQLEALVIGVGCNVTMVPRDLPYEATFLHKYNDAISLNNVMSKFVECFEKNKNLLYFEGFAIIRHKWLKRAYGIGQKVKIATLKQTRTGVMEGIDQQGQMLLRDDDGKLIIIHSGEVFFD